MKNRIAKKGIAAILMCSYMFTAAACGSAQGNATAILENNGIENTDMNIEETVLSDSTEEQDVTQIQAETSTEQSDTEESSAADSSSDSSSSDNSSSDSAETETAFTEIEIISNSTAGGYTVAIQKWQQDKNAAVSYPVLSDFVSEEVTNSWNDEFFQESILATADIGDATIEWGWEIATQDERILSLVETNYWNSPTAAHPWSGRSTVNISPVTGERIHLADICDTQAIAEDMLAQYEGTSEVTAYTAASPDGTDVTEYVTADELLAMNETYLLDGMSEIIDVERIKSLLDTVDTGAADDSVSGYSYWKDGQLHLVFGYYHAVGDYVDLTITDAHGSY